MRKTLIVVTVAMMLVALASVAFAASPSQLECEAAGGTFDRSQGTVTCIYPPVEDPVGNSENSDGKSQSTTTTEEESSNGTLNNKPKHEESSECDGPGNGGSTAQCP
jgi:hypothetical protein